VIDAIYEQGELIGFAKITREHHRTNHGCRALKESERHFRLFVSGVTDYALYMLDPSGIVTNWKRRRAAHQGLSARGNHRPAFFAVLFAADQAAGRPARALQLAVENGRYEEDGWRVRKDGTFFWASVVIDPIRDDDGKLARLCQDYARHFGSAAKPS